MFLEKIHGVCPACKRSINRNHITLGGVQYCDLRCYELCIKPQFNIRKFREGQGGEYADLEQERGGIEKDS